MVAATSFRFLMSTSTINALPVIKFVSICCCWYAAGASKKEWRHSLVSLTRTSREGSSTNPLPCRLLSAQLQCRDVRLIILSGSGTRSVPNAVALSNCRTPIESDSSRGWIPRLWVSRRRTNSTTLTSGYICSTFALRGSKATPTSSQKQLWGAIKILEQSWVVISLFFCCLSAVC